ncbi:MAG: hypothetical protein IT371_29390 [Deltaproteobacteria bacterium]|nr:hypothetical protein [Deltaproteobacteria bacterium]
MLRSLALLLLVPVVGCKGAETPECPTAFAMGDPCAWEFQVCPYPGGTCGTTFCQCKNQQGAFRWDCTVKNCSCTCPCGIVVVASCEALNCSKPEDKCPAGGLDRCKIQCQDAGVKDAGRDGPARDGGKRDGGKRDGGKDAARDKGADGPRDAARDVNGQ